MREDRLLMRFIILTGVLVSGIIALVIIITVAYVTIAKPEVTIQDVLVNWGGLIIGFYFGSFIGLVKDWFGLTRDNTGAPTPPSAAAP